MATPILHSTIPFDRSEDYSFFFSYSGNQSFANELLISDNETGEVVYNKMSNSFALNHLVESDSGLVNGKTYTAKIRVYYKNNASDTALVTTEYSSPIVFTCLAAPSFSIKNMSDGQVVQNQIFTVELDYSQEQGEKLDSFYFELYDANRQVMMTTDMIYDVSSLSYTFQNLTNKQTYYVAAFGQTIAGIPVQTKRVLFYIEYNLPEIFNVLTAENNRMPGTITVNSNVIVVEGSYDGQEKYIDNDKINLMDGVPVIYEEAFKINGEFSVQMLVNDFREHQPIFILGENKDIVLTVVPGIKDTEYEEMYYVQVKCKNGPFCHIIHSNYFNKTTIMINLRRTNSLFSIEVTEVG